MNTKDFWIALDELSPRLFTTYAAISKLSDNEVGYCFSSNQGISAKLGKHKDNVSRDISDLIEKGFLHVIEIKRGFVVVERRLYSNAGYKTYIEDKNNLANLKKTTYEKKGESENIVYYNEKNIKPTNDKTIIGTNDENNKGTDDKNVKLTISNINLSKSNYQKKYLKEKNNSNINKQYKTDPEILKKMFKNEKFDKNFIKYLYINYTIEEISFTYEKSKNKKNVAKYMRKCLENLPKNVYIPKTYVNIKETKNIIKKKMTTKEIIKNFLEIEKVKELKKLSKYTKELLNKTLINSGYKSINFS